MTTAARTILHDCTRLIIIHTHAYANRDRLLKLAMLLPPFPLEVATREQSLSRRGFAHLELIALNALGAHPVKVVRIWHAAEAYDEAAHITP